MRSGLFLIIIILACSVLSGICEEGQVDINTASIEELDTLYGVGPVKAEAIFNARPFASLENLLDVYGIGEKTLEKIKNQGLACVENAVEEEDLPDEEESLSPVPDEEEPEENWDEIYVAEPTNITHDMIDLAPQSIKSDENTKEKSLSKDKGSYAMYGFVGFCVLMGVLLVARRNKFKTEFEE